MGEFIPEVSCGSISPNRHWMVYRVEAGEEEVVPGGAKVTSWDQWAVDLESGERFMLQDGLRDCGGCDGRFGPDWSPGGDHIYYAETGGGRVWLSDVRNRTTVSLANGNSLGQQPRWHPKEDILLRPSASKTAMLHDVRAGSVQQLGVPWAAAWDSSGRYVYSPAFAGEPEVGEDRKTTVLDARTLQVVASISGAPASNQYYTDSPSAIVGTVDGFVAALENAAGCAGTAIYKNSTRLACVSKGVGALISPDGGRVALARATGKTGRAISPGIQTSSFTVYEIVVVEIATGKQAVLARDAYSENPPAFVWDTSSTKLYVRWPTWGPL
jgi:hypothetical protein